MTTLVARSMSPSAKALVRRIDAASSPERKLELVYEYATKVVSHPDATRDDVATILLAAIKVMKGTVVVTRRPPEGASGRYLKKALGLLLGGVMTVASDTVSGALQDLWPSEPDTGFVHKKAAKKAGMFSAAAEGGAKKAAKAGAKKAAKAGAKKAAKAGAKKAAKAGAKKAAKAGAKKAAKAGAKKAAKAGAKKAAKAGAKKAARSSGDSR